MSDAKDTPQPQTAPPEARTTATGKTVIGRDTRTKGELTFDEQCEVLGRFDGTITGKGELHVAEGATCKAEIEVGTVVVDGEIEGNITAREKVTLHATAKITGDVVTAKLEVSEGALFQGHLSVGGEGSVQTGRTGRRAESDQDDEEEPLQPTVPPRRHVSSTGPSGRSTSSAAR